MLAVRRLLTQRSSRIGRLQIEKCEGFRSSIKCNITIYFIARDVNQYMMKQFSNLSSYLLDSTSCISKSLPKNTHIYSQHETVLAELNRNLIETGFSTLTFCIVREN